MSSKVDLFDVLSEEIKFLKAGSMLVAVESANDQFIQDNYTDKQFFIVICV